MSRPISRAPETREAARAYVVRSWGDTTVKRLDTALRVLLSDMAKRAQVGADNIAGDAIRRLREALSAPAVRVAILKTAPRVAAEIRDSKVPEVQSILAGVQVLQAAFEQLHSKLDAGAPRASCYGGANDFRRVAAALHAYEKRPTATARHGLNAVLESRRRFPGGVGSLGNRRRARGAVPQRHRP